MKNPIIFTSEEQFIVDWIRKMRSELCSYHFDSGASFMLCIGRDFHLETDKLLNEKVRKWLAIDGNETRLSKAIDNGFKVGILPTYCIKIGRELQANGQVDEHSRVYVQ